VVVAVSVAAVFFAIVLMSRSLPRRVRQTSPETERHEVTSLERRTIIESQRQQPKPEIAGEHLIPSLVDQPEEPLPISPSTEPVVTSPPAEEEPAESKPTPQAETMKAEAAKTEDEVELDGEEVKHEVDAGLSAFMIEVSEDDGLSKIAESLEDIDIGNLVEVARDTLNKRAK